MDFLCKDDKLTSSIAAVEQHDPILPPALTMRVTRETFVHTRENLVVEPTSTPMIRIEGPTDESADTRGLRDILHSECSEGSEARISYQHRDPADPEETNEEQPIDMYVMSPYEADSTQDSYVHDTSDATTPPLPHRDSTTFCSLTHDAKKTRKRRRVLCIARNAAMRKHLLYMLLGKELGEKTKPLLKQLAKGQCVVIDDTEVHTHA